MPAERPSVDEGLACIRAHVRALGTERVAAADALGRVTAAPVTARRTVPGFRAAAMDGYALDSSAVRSLPVHLPIVARIAAGDAAGAIGPGEAAVIATGAPMPEGADAVVMVEHAALADAHRVTIASPVRTGLNVRMPGEDAAAGQALLPANAVVTPDVVAALAAFGVTAIDAVRAPTLAVLVTGSELAGDDPAVRDANGPMVAAAARLLGARVAAPRVVPDTAAALAAALDEAIAGPADMIVLTGGASRGERDLVRPALDATGACIHFHGLAMRPGKPVLFATLPDGRPVFGLPGNPVSACVGMRFFVTAAVRAMLGLPAERGEAVDSDEPGREGATVFLRGTRTGAGVDTACDQRSHVLSSLLRADSWLRIDQADGAVRRLAYPKTARLA